MFFSLFELDGQLIVLVGLDVVDEVLVLLLFL